MRKLGKSRGTPRRWWWSGNRPLTCRELVELITDYLEGTLEPVQRTRFEAHLERCANCTLYVEQMRTVLRVLGQISADDLDPVFRMRLMDAFDETAEA